MAKLPRRKLNLPILIFPDDVGLGDVHCTGGSFKTPNIDSLAAGGTRFEYCYSAPLCEPPRCQLLTGRYPFRTGMTTNHSDNAVDGKSISGKKGSMLEGGSRVPLIVNWSGTTPSGRVSRDLIDLSDFYSTFASLGNAKLPDGVELDSHSFADQIKGKIGKPREWVYVEMSGKSYVRNAGYKLTNSGELFDMSEAPFKEIAIANDTTEAFATAARSKLQRVLDQHPAAKVNDVGDHAGKKANTKAAGCGAVAAPKRKGGGLLSEHQDQVDLRDPEGVPMNELEQKIQ